MIVECFVPSQHITRRCFTGIFVVLNALALYVMPGKSGEIHTADSSTPVQFSDAESVLIRLKKMELIDPDGEGSRRLRMKRLGGLMAIDRSDEAVEEWEEWLESEQDLHVSLEFMHWYARTLVSTGKIHDAREVLSRCLSGTESPGDSMYYGDCIVLLADCTIQTGELETAIKTAQEFIQRSDNDGLAPLMLQHLGTAYSRTGDLESARNTWEVLIESYPGSPEASFAKQQLTQHPPEVRYTESATPDNDGGYTILLGSFRRTDEADALHDLLTRKGYPVAKKEIEVTSGPLTSILIGPYESHSRALDVREMLSVITDREGSILITTKPESP